MKLSLTNLHPLLRPPLPKWRRKIRRLIQLVSKEPGRFNGLCLGILSVVWMDDKKIAEIHRRHMYHRGPTDVLTFNYGKGCAEILISLDTALQQARQYHQTFDQELTLYLVHGILHLAGFRDKTSSQSRQMRRQERWVIRKLYETRC